MHTLRVNPTTRASRCVKPASKYGWNSGLPRLKGIYHEYVLTCAIRTGHHLKQTVAQPFEPGTVLLELQKMRVQRLLCTNMSATSGSVRSCSSRSTDDGLSCETKLPTSTRQA